MLLQETFLPKARLALGDHGSVDSFKRAEFVKALYEGEHTYRSVAKHCHAAWGGEWSPPDHPMMGVYLVEAAQKRMNVRFEG